MEEENKKKLQAEGKETKGPSSLVIDERSETHSPLVLPLTVLPFDQLRAIFPETPVDLLQDLLDGNKGDLERTVQQLIELTVIPEAPISESSSPQQPSSSTTLAPILTRARSKSKQSQSPETLVNQQADHMEKELKRLMIEEEEWRDQKIAQELQDEEYAKRLAAQFELDDASEPPSNASTPVGSQDDIGKAFLTTVQKGFSTARSKLSQWYRSITVGSDEDEAEERKASESSLQQNIAPSNDTATTTPKSASRKVPKYRDVDDFEPISSADKITPAVTTSNLESSNQSFANALIPGGTNDPPNQTFGVSRPVVSLSSSLTNAVRPLNTPSKIDP